MTVWLGVEYSDTIFLSVPIDTKFRQRLRVLFTCTKDSTLCCIASFTSPFIQYHEHTVVRVYRKALFILTFPIYQVEVGEYHFS